jgi:hypothetical protein
MQEIIAYGPSLYDLVAVYEATMVEQAENAVGRYGALKLFYPPATHLSDHPFCILRGEWVAPEEARAAQASIPERPMPSGLRVSSANSRSQSVASTRF